MPFNMVQMVMMHELAHNMHMNHGKNFWQARNKYAEELRALWSRKYTGEGFWGSGRILSDLQEVAGNNSMTAEDMKDVPVCGGTFRSRRRKRKRAGDGNEMTWKEKRDRRIEKKFGKNGQSLGEDEEQRIMLEIDRKGAIGGKPRVAQSKRGRELRAAAALARFGPNQQEVDELKKPEDESSDAEYEEDPSVKDEDAKDTNGQRLLDSMGFGVVRVCEDESPEDSQVKHEMDELAELNQEDWSRNSRPEVVPATETKRNPLYDIPQYRGLPTTSPPPAKINKQSQPPTQPKINITRLPVVTAPKHDAREGLLQESRLSDSNVLSQTQVQSAQPASISVSTSDCPICSLTNDAISATCSACSHVLRPETDRNHWRCRSSTCAESAFINGGDAGLCGVCGARRTVDTR